MIVDYLLGNSGLWQLGCLCVLILYCILRLIRKINYVVIYIGVMLAAFLLATIGYLQLFKILPSGNSHFSITGHYHNPAVYAGVMSLLLCVIVGFIIYTFGYSFYRKIRNISYCILFPGFYLCRFKSGMGSSDCKCMLGHIENL